MLTHLNLFSGIGGFSLAAQNCGFTTIAFCEIEPYAQQVLIEKFGAVMADANPSERRPQYSEAGHDKGRNEPDSIHGRKEISGGSSSCNSPRLHPDITKLDGTDYAGVTLLTGGFPCQPFSVAGKQRGKADNRHLWPQMCRVIAEARPHWVLGENVSGIVAMELDSVLSDLENLGYSAWPIVIPACAVDARHRRDRVWIVAYAARELHKGSRHAGQGRRCEHPNSGEDVAYASDARLQERELHPGIPIGAKRGNSRKDAAVGDCECTWQSEADRFAESAVCGVFDGLPEGLDGSDLDKEEITHNLMGYGTTTNTDRDKNLPSLRKTDDEEAIQRGSGGQKCVQQTEVLRHALHGKALRKRESNACGTKETSGEVSRNGVCRVQDDEESRCASSGRKSGEQRDWKSDDPMRFMPHEMALEERQAYCQWPEEDPSTPRVTTGIPHRAHRLRALGNAIVPQVAEEIIRGIAEIELST